MTGAATSRPPDKSINPSPVIIIIIPLLTRYLLFVFTHDYPSFHFILLFPYHYLYIYFTYATDYSQSFLPPTESMSSLYLLLKLAQLNKLISLNFG